MDILNFISWIRGGRQVTTVDPAKTLLPVGLKDPKRDDGYLAGAISVDDFAAQVGGLQTVSVDGVTITGDGTPGDPLVAVPSGPAYKVYTALLSQSGTSNPTQQVISNTIDPSFSISFTRSSDGLYLANLGLTSSCPLIIGKTIILCNAQGFFSGGPYIYAVPTFILGTGGPDTFLTCKFYAVDSSGNQTPYDITGDPVYFEIRVYP